MNIANFDLLNANGLNMQAVFNLSDLPENIRTGITQQVPDATDYRQLILIGHGGQQMWEQVQSSEYKESANPIDDFSIGRVQRWLSEQAPDAAYNIIYPAAQRVIPLQALGELAGWHHSSPFRVGINQLWGSWFAYRVAVLTDTDFNVTESLFFPSPCESCEAKPCMNACPAGALNGSDFSLKPCMNYRLAEALLCKDRCLSRLACPIAIEHRYSMEQIQYHYGCSMETIEKYQKVR